MLPRKSAPAFPKRRLYGTLHTSLSKGGKACMYREKDRCCCAQITLRTFKRGGAHFSYCAHVLLGPFLLVRGILRLAD